jgi:N-acetylmuramoyl-L-alanine amidase
MLNSAKVYTIVQDKNDGIRDDKYLNNSNKEVYYGGDTISHDQVTRLRKRAEIVNNLYKQNQNNGFEEQYIVVLHVDSRITDQRIDIFFYHDQNSTEGKMFANTLLSTIEEKYRIAQPGRGYDGSVSSRNLYMLKYTKPIGAYIELGNIQNPKDQVRLIESNNRQAIANWLTDGIIEYFRKK